MAEKGVRVKVRVIPRARRDEIAERRGDAVLVRLQAPPVEGAANKALVKVLSRHLGVHGSDIEIVSGEKSRDKVVLVRGLTAQEVQARLPG